MLEANTANLKGFALAISLPLLLLSLFVTKAFHLDDPVFIWCAEQILSNPLDFYGFSANWFYEPFPMYMINQNPPLVSYLIAFVGAVFGWHEWVLHTFFILPAVLLSAGTCSVSRFFCSSPQLAALIGVLTPIYLTSSTNIMAEVTMVAFYVWAIYFWLTGMENGKRGCLLVAALLISFSAMTKYFGASLIPLLFAHGFLVENKPRYWFLYLMIPVLVLLAYQWLTLHLYDVNLLNQAASFSQDNFKDGVAVYRKLFTSMSFLGGGMISVLFFTLYLWSKRVLIVAAAALTLMVIVFGYFDVAKVLLPSIATDYSDPAVETEGRWHLIFQLVLFSFAGLQILSLAVADLWKSRDSRSLFLILWLFGTLGFSVLVNWTINARILLPILPVMGILVVRRLNVREQCDFNRMRYVLPLLLAAALSLVVTGSDVSWANNQKQVAKEIGEELERYPHNVWFQGHWGLQYYLEQTKAQPLGDPRKIRQGDLVITPLNNSSLRLLPTGSFHLVDVKRKDICCPVRTMSRYSRAGFYSDYWGELPYSFAGPEADVFEIHIAGHFKSSAEAEDYYRLSKEGAP
jgi:4-amino-4-deoxy-L-arabinose transferase-like glycosyltransferase